MLTDGAGLKSETVSISPTGTQYEIVSAGHRAFVTELGAGLRSYSVDGRDVVHGFGEFDTIHGGCGQNLLPWPNRLRDGRYQHNGATWQLALTEPARHNAIHGLARYVPWRLVEHTADSVTNTIRIFPQQGWGGVLDATITHRVGDDGLTVTVTAVNQSAIPLPFGYAAHPYLTVGEETVDEIHVRVPATRYLDVDDRMLPVALHSVEGTDYDLRGGVTVGSLSLDTAMTGLVPDSDGRWRVRLERGERTAELWGDASMPWVQVFTGGPHRDWSLAVEPMSCGPDAFNEGVTRGDLVVLAPGEEFHASWGIVGN